MIYENHEVEMYTATWGPNGHGSLRRNSPIRGEPILYWVLVIKVWQYRAETITMQQHMCFIKTYFMNQGLKVIILCDVQTILLVPSTLLKPLNCKI